MRVIDMDLQHIDAVMEIEREAFVKPWTKKEMTRAIRASGWLAQAALSGDGDVMGFVIYEFRPEHIFIHDLAVGVPYRRQGVATRLIEAVRRRLASRVEIRVLINEKNLGAQLCYKASGYRWVNSLPGCSSDGSDVYELVYFKNGEPVNAWESVPDDKGELCDEADKD